MPIPEGQEWFIERSKSLGYKTRESGMCFGIAHMGMQAMLARDLKTFDDRLHLIASIKKEDFANKINIARENQPEKISQRKSKNK